GRAGARGGAVADPRRRTDRQPRLGLDRRHPGPVRRTPRRRGDRRADHPRTRGGRTGPAGHPDPGRGPPLRRGGAVNWWETIRTGLQAVRTHRLRSGLTVLGILIGIAAVVLSVGLGEGASSSVKSQIAALGSNLLIVSPGSQTATTGIRGGLG